MLKQIAFTCPDPIDQTLITWLSEEIKIDELKKNKTLNRIITEDVAPKIHGLVEKLNSQDVIALWERDIIDSDGELQPLGKGYVACLMANL